MTAYICLLRGINVGKGRQISMKKVKSVFEELGYGNVTTYINSGNVIFKSKKNKGVIQREIASILKKEAGFEIPALVKNRNEMLRIARAIPRDWENDGRQRTDVAYLFDKIDSRKILDDLPFDKKYIDARYIKGAVFWNLDRKNIYKSKLGKLIGRDIYKYMTMRNVNTARFLAQFLIG